MKIASTLFLSLAIVVSGLVSSLAESRQVDWVKIDRKSSGESAQNLEVYAGRSVAWGGENSYGKFLVSNDGRNWDVVDVPSRLLIENVLFKDGIWLVSVYRQTFRSEDLKNWTTVIDYGINDGIDPKSVGLGYFWGKHGGSYEWYRSSDGVSWDLVANPFTSKSQIELGESKITEIDKVASGNNTIMHGPHSTYYGRGVWVEYDGRERTIKGSIAFTTDGTQWFYLQVQMDDGHIVTGYPSPSVYEKTLGLVNGKTPVEFKQNYYHLNRDTYTLELLDQWTGLHRVVDVFDNLEIEENELLREVFTDNSKLFVSTSLGRVLESDDGVVWQQRIAKNRLGSRKHMVLNDSILFLDMADNCYISPARTDTSDAFELVINVARGIMDIHPVGDKLYGRNGKAVFESNDGSIWRQVLHADLISVDEPIIVGGAHISKLKVANDALYAFGRLTSDELYPSGENSIGVMWNSIDGENWSSYEVTLDGESFLDWQAKLVYGNEKWILYQREKGIAVSTNGYEFTRVENALVGTMNFHGVAYFNDVFVSYGNSTFLHSEDGYEWQAAESMSQKSERNHPGGYSFYQLEDYVVALSYTEFWISEDGKNWTQEQMLLENPGPTYSNIFYQTGSYIRYSGWGFNDDREWQIDRSVPVGVNQFFRHPGTNDTWLVEDYTGETYAPSTVLDKPRVTVEAVNDNAYWLAEGGNYPVFSVKRTGSTDYALDVRFNVLGTAVHGVDYTLNVGQTGDQFVLHFDPGFSELHLYINAISDGISEGFSENIILEILDSPDYDINDIDRSYMQTAIYDLL